MSDVWDYAKNGDSEKLEKFLNEGPNIQDRGGSTPLHYACVNGHEGCVTLLLDHGADMEIQDKTGLTPLQLAQFRNKTTIVQLSFLIMELMWRFKPKMETLLFNLLNQIIRQILFNSWKITTN